MALLLKQFFVLLALLGASTAVQAQTWLASPGSNDWNTGSNWDTTSVPNGTSASATLGTSSVTAMGLSAGTTVGNLLFNGSSSYLVTTNGNLLDLAGTGINNTSGVSQTLRTNSGEMLFQNNAQVVGVLLQNSLNSIIQFQDTAAAGTATILNSGTLNFIGTASAASASIFNTGSGSISFAGNSAGGQAWFDLSSGTTLDISQDTAGGVTVGSIEGAGTINLGANQLTTGISSLSATISGAINDGGSGGSLTKNGLGTLTLTGSNAFSGGTSIIGGEIFLSGGSLGSGPVVNQGTLVYALATTAVNQVTNTGTLIFQDNASAGSATLINNSLLNFNNNSSAASASIVNQGTVNFNNSATAANAAITNSGLMQFYNGSSAGSAVFHNGGAIYFTGDSATTMASAGGAGIDDGNLVQFQNFSTAGNASITVENSSTVNFTGNAQGGSSQYFINNGGTFNISGSTAGSISVDHFYAVAGSFVDLGSTDLTLISLFSSSVTSIIAGTVSGNGGTLTVLSSVSKLMLLGSNSYSGGTSILGGTLIVGDTNALGSGHVYNSGNLTVFGGPLSILVGGSYTQTSTGTLFLGLGGTAPLQSDAMSVTGTANLNGVLSIAAYGLFTPTLGDSFTVLTSVGGVSGNFSSVVNPFTGLRLLPYYLTNQVDLIAIQPSFTVLASTFNQKAVATALDAGVFDPTLQSLMAGVGVQSVSALPADYDLVSPAGLTPLFQMGFNLAQARAAMTSDRLNDIWASIDTHPQDWAGWGEPQFAANLGADQEKAMADNASEHGRWGAFAQGLGNFGTVTGDGNGPGYQFSTGGVAAGMDYRMSKDLVGGLLIGYNQSGTSQALDSVSVSGGQVGLYGGWRSGNLRLQGLVDGGVNNYNTTRTSYGGTATGTTRGMQVGMELGGEVDWDLDGLKVGPLVTGQFTHVSISAFSESGSASPLAFPDQGQDQLTSALGLQMAKAIPMGGLTIEPNVKALWEHLFQGNLDQITAGLTSSQGTFVVEGPALGTDGFRISAGLKAQLAKGLALQAQYEGLIGLTNYTSQDFTGGVSLDF